VSERLSPCYPLSVPAITIPANAKGFKYNDMGGPRYFAVFRLGIFLLLCFSGGMGQALGASPIYSYFPQLAVGGGWSCDVFVINQDSRRVDDLTLAFYASTGSPLIVSTNLGNSASFKISLAPGGTQLVRLSPSGQARIGYAVLTAPAGSSVQASLVFFYRQANQVINQLGIQQITPSTHFSFPAEVDIARGISTGIALCNPSLPGNSGALEVTVSLINESGEVTAFCTTRIDPGRHLARFLHENEFFPFLKTFRGSVNVAAVRPFGLIALRQEQNSVGSLTVSSSPVTGAFVQTGLFWAEEEPNNSAGAPQEVSLPTRISAGFAQSDDIDFYRFSAKAGDIITALTELEDPGIDPVLTLMTASGTVLGQNDQNGLPGRKDAFLQARLPSTGDYLLKVSEAGGKPGNTFGYELHARILGEDAYEEGPRIEAMYPERVVPGNTINLEIQGNVLCGSGSVRVLPPEGITMSQTRSASNRFNARLSVDPDANTGVRLISVQTAFGNSNAAALLISKSGSVAPKISNLSVGAPRLQGTTLLIDFGFDFTDKDGDLTFQAGKTYGNAKIWFTKQGSNSCRNIVSNSFLHMPGKTSGRLSFTLGLGQQVDCASEVVLELLDSAGNISNPLTFKPPKWSCGP